MKEKDLFDKSEVEEDAVHQRLLPGEKVPELARADVGDFLLFCPTPAPAGHPLPRERAMSNFPFINLISHKSNAISLHFLPIHGRIKC